MRGLLIPGGMALAGLALGGGAAAILSGGTDAPEVPPEAAAAEPEGGGEAPPPPVRGSGAEEAVPAGYVALDDQFVVPVIEDGRLTGLVTMTLGLETGPAGADIVLEREPKVRDALLRVLLDHANTGGFEGGFTDDGRVDALGEALLEGARAVVGPPVRDVLILNLLRQDT